MIVLDKFFVRLLISFKYIVILLINRIFYLSGQGRVVEYNYWNKYFVEVDFF